MRLVIMVLASAAVGCGGKIEATGTNTVGHRSSITSPDSPSQFIAQADSICQGLNAKLAATKPKNQSIKTIARLAPGRAELERQAVAQLARLIPPSPLAHDWQQIISYRLTLAGELASLGQKAKANDAEGVAAFAKSKQAVHGMLLAVANRDRFKQCGKVGR